MKKKKIIIIAAAVALVLVIISAVAVKITNKTKGPVVHCYDFSAAYDYATENGYPAFIIFSPVPPEFGSMAESFEYTEKDGQCFISKYNGTEKEIYIPEEYKGKAVVGVCENAFDGKQVDEIYFPAATKFINCVFE